jgi:hypothetical protein
MNNADLFVEITTYVSSILPTSKNLRYYYVETHNVLNILYDDLYRAGYMLKPLFIDFKTNTYSFGANIPNHQLHEKHIEGIIRKYKISDILSNQ